MYPLLLLIATCTASAQDAPKQIVPRGTISQTQLFEEPDWQTVCLRALAAPLPEGAARLSQAAAEQRALPGRCDEQALYYGFGEAPRYKEALACGYWRRAHPDAPGVGSLDGAGTLAMLYANGDGVAQDYALAIRFACEVGNAGGSNEPERLGRLEALRAGKLPPGTRFDLCDEQMSGAMGAYCSGLQERKDDVERARRIAAVKARLKPRAQALLPQLMAAESAFEQARQKGEYPGGGGSGSAGFALDDQNKLREQFVRNLERFTARQGKRATASERVRAQRELDATYAKALAVPRDPHAPFGEATTAGLIATQAAWQRLFEEWMRFLSVASGETTQDGAATELLRLRTHQLRRVSR